MTADIQQAILKTIVYADLFDYPLTVSEIQRYLVDQRTDRRSLEKTLTRMAADGKLVFADIFYCLPDREDTAKLRRRRKIYSQVKVKKATRIASVLKFIPWIKLIGVTGAAAMGNSDEDDDIDLMIITATGRLWLTRGLIVTFLRLTGRYRRPRKIKDMICPNLMISEDALEFPDRDLFTAHEIVQMRPIYDRENTYQKFLQANEWVGDFLPNWKPKPEMKPRNRRLTKPMKLPVLHNLSQLERFAYLLQLRYMEKKKTTEVTTPSLIRFHPQDIRQKVLDEYKKRVYNLPK